VQAFSKLPGIAVVRLAPESAGVPAGALKATGQDAATLATLALKARMAERSLDEWRDIISRIERSSFCRGLTGGGTWVASFDWLIGSADTALKVLEGKYDDRTPAAVVPGKSEIQREFERKYGDMRVDLSRRQA